MEKRLRMGDFSTFGHVLWSCASSSRLCPSSVLCAGQATQPRARAFSAGPDSFVWSGCRHFSCDSDYFLTCTKLRKNWSCSRKIMSNEHIWALFQIRWESVQNLLECSSGNLELCLVGAFSKCIIGINTYSSSVVC